MSAPMMRDTANANAAMAITPATLKVSRNPGRRRRAQPGRSGRRLLRLLAGVDMSAVSAPIGCRRSAPLESAEEPVSLSHECRAGPDLVGGADRLCGQLRTAAASAGR